MRSMTSFQRVTISPTLRMFSGSSVSPGTRTKRIQMRVVPPRAAMRSPNAIVGASSRPVAYL